MLKILFFLALLNYNFSSIIKFNKYKIMNKFIDNEKRVEKDVKIIKNNPEILKYKSNRKKFKLNNYFKSLSQFDKKINYFFHNNSTLTDDFLNINNKNKSLINYSNNDSHLMWVVLENNNLFKKGDIVCFDKNNFNDLENIFNKLENNVTIYKMNYNISENNTKFLIDKFDNDQSNKKKINLFDKFRNILVNLLSFVQSEFRFFLNIQILKIKILFNIKIIADD